MLRVSPVIRQGVVVLGVSLIALSLGSCKLAKNQLQTDRAAQKDRQDYRDSLGPMPMPKEQASSMPEFQPIVSTPAELRLPSPLVTVSVNQTVSLRDLMFELAEQAGVDFEMDPQIRGSLIFTAKDRPFDEVVERIAAMAGLRYKFTNNVLRFELDRPYVKSYNLSYMNSTRKAKSKIDTSVSTSAKAATGASVGSGSSASIDNNYESDFWGEVKSNLEQILSSSDTYTSLATLADPVAVVEPPPAPPAPPVDPNNPNAVVTPPPLPTNVPPTLTVTLPPASSEPLIPNAPATFSISKQTGTVSVFASERQQKQVQKFLSDLGRVSTTQILIEAKVLEVALTDEYSAGIDWSKINLTGMADFTVNTPAVNLNPVGTGAFFANVNLGNNIDAALVAISRFGTVRALSSPRVTVLNNQPATVNVAENKVFFDLSVTVTPAILSNGVVTSPAVQSWTVERQSVPEGVLMSVVPTSNPDTGEILLSLRPTITKITKEIEDPVIKLVEPTSTVQNLIPQMAVQEIDSIVKMQSGQTVVMGGLMKDSNQMEEVGVPVLGDIPLIGSMFRNHSDKIQKSELVIFLHATIIPGANADDMDRKIYKDYSLDRRPVRM
jgi:general secretion pathway protein D